MAAVRRSELLAMVMVMVMVLYRCWCLNSPRPLLRRLRPGLAASLHVWEVDTRPSDPVFAGPGRIPEHVCRCARVRSRRGRREGRFVLMCVTSHARVFQCTRSRRHLGFEVGPAGRNPLKLCVYLVACMGRSAIGLAAGLAPSLTETVYTPRNKNSGDLCSSLRFLQFTCG